MLSILLVDDDHEFTEVASRIIDFLGHTVSVAGSLAEANEWLEHNSFDHILLDFMLPDGSGIHLMDKVQCLFPVPKVTFITGHPLVKSIIAELCGPNVDYLLKPIQRECLERVLNPATQKLKKSSAQFDMHFGCLIGESAPMQALYNMIERVAASNANVMLLGESGVGKELVASAIHYASKATGAFVATNCGGLSKELISSELFGHEKGAFTGAVMQKIGVFERSQGGTLFLDEVTEMPLDMQPHLLRVLETKKIVRVGGSKEIAVDCRVVSATNRSLENIAEKNILREDIYFRLAVFPIEIPPLRERTADIPLLAKAFLASLNDENGTNYQFSNAQLKRLASFDWPGNIRELRHTVHRAYIMSDPSKDEVALPASFASPFSVVQKEKAGLAVGKTIDEVERELIYLTLKKVGGNKATAADMLGVSVKTLYNRLSAYGGLGEFS